MVDVPDESFLDAFEKNDDLQNAPNCTDLIVSAVFHLGSAPVIANQRYKRWKEKYFNLIVRSFSERCFIGFHPRPNTSSLTNNAAALLI